jgi:NF-kappa-B inhibitor alpha
LAIIQELEEIVYKLIRIVPHPDFLDIFNHLSQTPLHLATLTRQPNIVRRLIISGATIDLRDRHGNTALHVACAQSDFDSVQAIISPIHEREIRAADVVNYPIDVQRLPNDLLKLRNYEGETCIHLAAYNTNKNIIELLVKCGADVNAQEGKSGKGILHWAVEMRNLDLIKFLVKRCNADVNLRSYAGHTPLHLAWSLLTHNNNKMKAIVKYLIDCGGEPSLPPNDSDSDIDSLSDDE